MMLFRDFFAAATAASAMFVGVAFVVMPAAASVLVGVAFVFVVMTAAASVFMGVTFVVMVMPAAAAVFVGVAFVVVVMSAAATVFVGVTFVDMFMTASAVVLVGVAFVVVPTAAALGFFVFLVVGMLFGVMGSFLRLMAVAASAVMYMLFIVLFHGMSPYSEWKLCFLSGIILWCYFSILQMHRKWSMRNTLIFQVGQGETIGLDRAKKNEFERGSKNEK